MEAGALAALMKLGMYRSVDTLTSLNPSATVPDLIERARCLVRQKRFNDALRVLDSIPEASRKEDETNAIIEMKFKCYFANQATCATKCAALLPLLEGRQLTPKIHIYMAEAYLLQDSTHYKNHPAIPHLVEVLAKYPYAVEIAEKLINIGGSVDELLAQMAPGPVRTYLEAMKLSAIGEFTQANELLNAILKQIEPHPVCVLNKICLNAWHAGQMDLFDNMARMIPMGDLAIVDIRADRYADRNAYT